MTPEKFKQVVEEALEHCTKTLLEKNSEYSRNNNRLWNFKIAGRKLGVPPEIALLGMKVKHTVSIEDVVNDVVNGKPVPDKAYLLEKFGDEINYNLLLLALLLERRKNDDRTMKSFQAYNGSPGTFETVEKEIDSLFIPVE